MTTSDPANNGGTPSRREPEPAGDADPRAKPPADVDPLLPQAAGSSPEETPTAPQPSLGEPAPAVPDWSTPDTVASAPPLGGGYQPPVPHAGELTPPPAGGPVDLPAGPPHHRRSWLILGVAAALMICCLGATLVALTWGGDVFRDIRERGQRTVGLNEPARDGNLEFQVRGVECGIAAVGDPFINQSAVGQFCVVDLAVRNVGRRPVIFSDSLQTAYGPAGEQFLADSSAGILANADQQVFLSDINPGNQVTGALVYDIPPGSRIVRVRLHHAARSRGVTVKTG